MGDAQEFYVGYTPRAPRGLARRARLLVAALVLLAPLLAVAVALTHPPVDPGTYEFGVVRSFEGTVRAQPLPLLLLEHDGRRVAVPLVAPGKFGAHAFAAPLDGARVQLTATLIRRRGQTMMELQDPEAVRVLEAAAAGSPPRVEDLGEATLVGEVVDTKCFYGVMRPAQGKVHRACAIRCLSGGVPPGLWVRDGHGTDVVLLLVGEAGAPLRIPAPLIGVPVRATGRAEILDGVPVLRVRALDPG